MEYEYTVLLMDATQVSHRDNVKIDPQVPLSRYLNDMGKEGWEVCGAYGTVSTDNDHWGVVIAKRPR